MTTLPTYQLRLLGGFTLERGAQPCKLQYEKGRALLAYLAMEPHRAHPRAALAALLWPDLVREAALANLRQVLHDLRRVLNAAGAASPVLQVAREYIQLDPVAGLQIDAAAFAMPSYACPAAPCADHCNPCLAQMESLVSLYQGDFMAGFSLPDCQPFEQWQQVQREALHLRALGLLSRLAACHEQMGAYAKALPFAQRFLELEPLNEDALRRAMRLLALNGQSAAALAQYETCCLVLNHELGVLFSEETHALAQRIRWGELTRTTRRAGDPPSATALPLPVARPAGDAPVVATLPLPVAQRRQVTVLYCELSCIAAEDPDEALALLHGPQMRCSEIIRGASGYLVQIRGGSLLAYFGYPLASENAARMAVQAALAVTHAAFAGLEVRASVHTGLVISGDPQVPDAIGATSGLTIRLRQLAQPAEVVISSATQRLVAGYFESRSLGLHPLPGSSRALEVFQITRDSGASSRLEAAATLTPLVGRQDEIASLLAQWQDVRRGGRRIVLLRGEAGIGKSRLVHTLRESLRNEACVVRELHCVAEHGDSPLYPLSALFGLSLAYSPEDMPPARFDKLAAFVEAFYTEKDADTVALLASMLSLPLRAPYRVPDASAQQQREKTLAILLERLYALARQQPVLLIVEDLHWADPSTLDFLKLFVMQQRMAPILAVFTARPGLSPPWLEQLACTLPLNALDDAETSALVAAVAPELTPATVGRIVERADGIPLFAEELARGFAANDQLDIPPTLQDLLMTRLDGMGPAKTIAQLAATIGRDFSFKLLQQISAVDDALLLHSLRQLLEAGLLQGEARTGFNFRHALIRDAAYQSQTRAQREAVHRQIADALKTSGTQARPELMAQHWAAGGETCRAIVCWIEAGKLASQHAASQEAILHFKSGLALVETLAPGPLADRLALDLQIGLGAAACAAQGYASAEGVQAYTRAMTLCSQSDGGPDLFAAVWGLWASTSSRTGYASALALAQQLLRMASPGGDPAQTQQAHFAAGDTLYWQGEFAMAREHLEQVRALYQGAHHAGHVAVFGEDAGVTSGSYRAWVLWFQGFPEQARQASEQAVALARELGHPFSLAYALTFAAILHCRLRQPETALALAQETLGLASRHGFPLWQIGSMLSRGWALSMQHQHEGVQTLLQCVATMRAAMGGVTLVVLAPLVDAHVALGQFDAALGVNDEAFAVGAALGDHHADAELHRLKGESLRGLADDAQAQASARACFEQALAISRQQQAKSLELRAAMSLARLWQRQGQPDKARHLLEEVYHWFTEGWDTPDLRDARELLAALAREENCQPGPSQPA